EHMARRPSARHAAPGPRSASTHRGRPGAVGGPFPRVTRRTSALLSSLLLSLLPGSPLLHAQEVAEELRDTQGRTQLVEQQWSHVGLLRARDLTPFGLLRLDMLPSHTADAAEGKWTFELQYAYQNTFVLSD